MPIPGRNFQRLQVRFCRLKFGVWIEKIVFSGIYRFLSFSTGYLILGILGSTELCQAESDMRFVLYSVWNAIIDRWPWFAQVGFQIDTCNMALVADQNRVWPILTYQRASTQHQIENSTQLTVKTITGIPSSFNKIIMGINVKYSVLLFKNYRFIVFDSRNDTTKILEHKRKSIVFTAFFNACIIRQAKPIKIYQWVISACSDSRTSKETLPHRSWHWL